ncbi:exonuclease domain-containing protein [Paludibacterium purpuratum]|uniref:DNA polymerase-3 subunit epsilon n=1 Tax=Paludibacterium purpuratum TaxID=1144873 RepID=A0A4R7BD41_9NEIS|nr:exonuclease domain-containing protein [Paludibacterium purpuratum]TDR82623.1 DNA polymerase-3 subunit epsilon [Paludibacterium purpuratum]
MLLLGLDLETGGAFNGDPADNFITEVGLVLWDSEFGEPVEWLSVLLKPEGPVSPESAEMTGLSDALLARHGRPWDIRTLQPIATLMQKADYVVAHNGREFDRQMLERAFVRFGLKLPATPWLDTQYDIDYPRACNGRQLIYLAGFHGLLNHFQHRAIGDAMTMLAILQRYDLAQVIANSQRKWLIVQANVQYDERDKAKERGFRWQSDGGRHYEKCWVKRIREDQLTALQAACDFNLTVLERA